MLGPSPAQSIFPRGVQTSPALRPLGETVSAGSIVTRGAERPQVATSGLAPSPAVGPAGAVLPAEASAREEGCPSVMSFLQRISPPAEGVRLRQADTEAVLGGEGLGTGSLYVAER